MNWDRTIHPEPVHQQAKHESHQYLLTKLHKNLFQRDRKKGLRDITQREAHLCNLVLLCRSNLVRELRTSFQKIIPFGNSGFLTLFLLQKPVLDPPFSSRKLQFLDCFSVFKKIMASFEFPLALSSFSPAQNSHPYTITFLFAFFFFFIHHHDNAGFRDPLLILSSD